MFLSLLFFFIFSPQRKLRSISISSLSSFHFLFFFLLSREKEGWDVLANEVKRRRKLHFFCHIAASYPEEMGGGVGARPTPCLVLHPIFIPRSQRRPKRREEAEMKDAAFLPLLSFPLPILRRPHGLAVKKLHPSEFNNDERKASFRASFCSVFW